MATQLAPQQEEPQETERNYEAEARQHNWQPKDEFKGDASLWVDAETFVKRADEVMPLLKAKTRHLERELAEVRKSSRRMEEHFNKAEARIRAELMAEMEQAVETGDVEAFRRAKRASDEIGTGAEAPKVSDEEARGAYDDFRERNFWYDRGALASATEDQASARIYADRMAEKHMEKTKTMAPPEFFAMIEGLVQEKYPQIGAKAPRVKPQSDVAGVTPGRPRSGAKTFNDLPAEAQRACDKWVKQGLIKDRAAYVASYDFGA